MPWKSAPQSEYSQLFLWRMIWIFYSVWLLGIVTAAFFLVIQWPNDHQFMNCWCQHSEEFSFLFVWTCYRTILQSLTGGALVTKLLPFSPSVFVHRLVSVFPVSFFSAAVPSSKLPNSGSVVTLACLSTNFTRSANLALALVSHMHVPSTSPWVCMATLTLQPSC